MPKRNPWEVLPSPVLPGAACVGMPSYLWDEVEQRRGAGYELPLATRQAIAVCQSCPVQGDCLAYGERYPVTGVWGGKLFSMSRAYEVAGAVRRELEERAGA